jgi:hypothetical protein
MATTLAIRESKGSQEKAPGARRGTTGAGERENREQFMSGGARRPRKTNSESDTRVFSNSSFRLLSAEAEDEGGSSFILDFSPIGCIETDESRMKDEG